MFGFIMDSVKCGFYLQCFCYIFAGGFFLAVFQNFLRARINSSLRHHQIFQKFLKKGNRWGNQNLLRSGTIRERPTCFTKWEHSINNIESESSEIFPKLLPFKKCWVFGPSLKWCFHFNYNLQNSSTFKQQKSKKSWGNFIKIMICKN